MGVNPLIMVYITRAEKEVTGFRINTAEAAIFSRHAATPEGKTTTIRRPFYVVSYLVKVLKPPGMPYKANSFSRAPIQQAKLPDCERMPIKMADDDDKRAMVVRPYRRRRTIAPTSPDCKARLLVI